MCQDLWHHAGLCSPAWRHRSLHIFGSTSFRRGTIIFPIRKRCVNPLAKAGIINFSRCNFHSSHYKIFRYPLYLLFTLLHVLLKLVFNSNSSHYSLQNLDSLITLKLNTHLYKHRVIAVNKVIIPTVREKASEMGHKIIHI